MWRPLSQIRKTHGWLGSKATQKTAKSRTKREQRRKQARLLEAKFQGAGLLRMASNAPFGPCWVGVSLDEVESEEPPLVAVIVTRRVRGQLCGVFAVRPGSRSSKLNGRAPRKPAPGAIDEPRES